jgi:hypothetical protein
MADTTIHSREGEYIQSQEVQDLAKQMITILRCDLGYKSEPRHGHNPLRHQFAWSFAEKILGEDGVEKQLKELNDNPDNWSRVKKFYCDTCGDYTDYRDDGDIYCKECGLVIATYKEDME